MPIIPTMTQSRYAGLDAAEELKKDRVLSRALWLGIHGENAIVQKQAAIIREIWAAEIHDTKSIREVTSLDLAAESNALW